MSKIIIYKGEERTIEELENTVDVLLSIVNDIHNAIDDSDHSNIEEVVTAATTAAATATATAAVTEVPIISAIPKDPEILSTEISHLI